MGEKHNEDFKSASEAETAIVVEPVGSLSYDQDEVQESVKEAVIHRKLGARQVQLASIAGAVGA